jgi:hypothetical protein
MRGLTYIPFKADALTIGVHNVESQQIVQMGPAPPLRSRLAWRSEPRSERDVGAPAVTC